MNLYAKVLVKVKEISRDLSTAIAFLPSHNSNSKDSKIDPAKIYNVKWLKTSSDSLPIWQYWAVWWESSWTNDWKPAETPLYRGQTEVSRSIWGQSDEKLRSTASFWFLEICIPARPHNRICDPVRSRISISVMNCPSQLMFDFLLLIRWRLMSVHRPSMFSARLKQLMQETRSVLCRHVASSHISMKCKAPAFEQGTIASRANIQPPPVFSNIRVPMSLSTWNTILGQS